MTAAGKHSNAAIRALQAELAVVDGKLRERAELFDQRAQIVAALVALGALPASPLSLAADVEHAEPKQPPPDDDDELEGPGEPPAPSRPGPDPLVRRPFAPPVGPSRIREDAPGPSITPASLTSGEAQKWQAFAAALASGHDNPADLAQALGVTSSCIRKQINKYERLGYIRARGSTHARRIALDNPPALEAQALEEWATFAQALARTDRPGDLAKLLGLSLYRLNRRLDRYQGLGYVHVEGETNAKRITLASPPRMTTRTATP